MHSDRPSEVSHQPKFIWQVFQSTKSSKSRIRESAKNHRNKGKNLNMERIANSHQESLKKAHPIQRESQRRNLTFHEIQEIFGENVVWRTVKYRRN